MNGVNRVVGVIAVMGGVGFGIGFASSRWTSGPAEAAQVDASHRGAASASPPSAAASPPSAAVSPSTPPTGATPAPSVPPSPSTAASAAEFIGVLVTGFGVEIAPKVEGKVDAVFFHVGDRVATGTPLANVDVSRARRDLASSEADLKAEEATCRDSELQLQRKTPLAGRAISRQEVDTARATARAACAKLEAQQAKVQQYVQLVADAELRAPFDGVVTALYVDPGTVVGPNRPVMRLLGESNPQVRFGVPDDAVGEVRVGRGVRVTLPAAGAVGGPIVGVVTRVAPEEDSSSRMIFAVADVELPESVRGRLSSGVVVRVAVAPELRMPRMTPVVPREARESQWPPDLRLPDGGRAPEPDVTAGPATSSARGAAGARDAVGARDTVGARTAVVAPFRYEQASVVDPRYPDRLALPTPIDPP